MTKVDDYKKVLGVGSRLKLNCEEEKVYTIKDVAVYNFNGTWGVGIHFEGDEGPSSWTIIKSLIDTGEMWEEGRENVAEALRKLKYSG